jgi:Tol biopolymer transport system component/predicted Ser/Thr protein kinase
MTLAPGARLGPYEVQSAIGAGGMGEVYRARDTRLNRIVALKLLSASFADRADPRQRFQHEARAISALQHPHICTLFDVGEQDGHAFLVMEYLEGETLDDRLTRGPLPARDVLIYSQQIAEALDHAHRAQIVHRDLKPSNVMLTQSGAKLLDFGLARGLALPPRDASSTASFPHEKLTAEGTLVGTFPYMAPEQLEGKTADERTDIFAFGTLAYEMATGRRAFEGESQASLIASILTAQPPSLSSTRAARRADGLPEALDHIVDRCLAKNPGDRWQTARDLTAEIRWVVDGGSRSGVWKPAARASLRRREAFAWAIALAAVLAAIAAFVVVGRRQETPGLLTKFSITLPPGVSIPRSTGDATFLAVSPDGRYVTFIGTRDGVRRLFVQSFETGAARMFEDIIEPFSPFWSPDSRFIGYFARDEGALKKVDIAGGPSRTICGGVLSGQPLWHRDGTIFYTEFRKGLYRVSADGGEPVQITRVDQSTPAREINHYWPSVLPDGRHLLYMTTRLSESGQRATPIVYVASLETGERREVARVNSRMVYASPGRVLYVHEGSLLAQAFDRQTFKLTGEPVQVVESLDYNRSTGASAFSLSDTGVLASHRGGTAFQLAWFDRSGKEVGTVGDPQAIGHVRISPGGDRAAIDVTNPRLGTSDIWTMDFERGVAMRVTSDVNSERLPAWSPDSERIAFYSDRGSGSDASGDFFMKRSDGTGDEQLFFDQVGPQFIEDWSSDGRYIAYRNETRETGDDFWLLPLTGDRKPRPLMRTASEEWGPRFSPDSSWVAFASNESGRNEVYVTPTSGPAARRHVSTGGGGSPRWRRDGKELFYLSGDGRSLMAVPITLTNAAAISGVPQRLFTLDRQKASPGNPRNLAYDVAPDGQRFLFVVAAVEQPSPQISVITNWTTLLTR